MLHPPDNFFWGELCTESEDFHREISAIPIIERTFEQTVYNKFSKHNLEPYIKEDQFAYRMGDSCTNALLKMQHLVHQALDNPKTFRLWMFSQWIFLKLKIFLKMARNSFLVCAFWAADCACLQEHTRLVQMQI